MQLLAGAVHLGQTGACQKETHWHIARPSTSPSQRPCTRVASTSSLYHTCVHFRPFSYNSQKLKYRANHLCGSATCVLSANPPPLPPPARRSQNCSTVAALPAAPASARTSTVASAVPSPEKAA